MIWPLRSQQAPCRQRIRCQRIKKLKTFPHHLSPTAFAVFWKKKNLQHSCGLLAWVEGRRPSGSFPSHPEKHEYIVWLQCQQHALKLVTVKNRNMQLTKKDSVLFSYRGCSVTIIPSGHFNNVYFTYEREWIVLKERKRYLLALGSTHDSTFVSWHFFFPHSVSHMKMLLLFITFLEHQKKKFKNLTCSSGLPYINQNQNPPKQRL